jgi:hypothetical protein
LTVAAIGCSQAEVTFLARSGGFVVCFLEGPDSSYPVTGGERVSSGLKFFLNGGIGLSLGDTSRLRLKYPDCY